MKFYTSAALALLMGSAAGFRDQETKKVPKEERQLEETCDYVVNHDAIQSLQEVTVTVYPFVQYYATGKYKNIKEGSGLFDIEICDEPWAPKGQCRRAPGWCIDYTRSIGDGTKSTKYTMDVFSIYDEDLHKYSGATHGVDAKYDHNVIVDKPERLPNLAWIINNINVGDVVKKGDVAGDPTCAGTIKWPELQGGIWRTVDFENGAETTADDTGKWYLGLRNDCISKHIAAKALQFGNNYEIDCTDPNEEIPVVYVVDATIGGTGEGDIIQNQVIISETKVSGLPGLCTCQSPSPTAKPTASPTAKPTPSPTASPTAKPTPGPTAKPTPGPTASPTASPTNPPTSPPVTGFPAPPKDTPAPTPAPVPASSSGDPHFKTWNGDKFDYHGECDLALVHNPGFGDGLGLYIHIRTTRVKYFSYIETIAIRMGDQTLEFNNDVSNFLINGQPVGAIEKHVETRFAGFLVRRDPKAVSIRLDNDSRAKIDLIQRTNGFPAVVLDGGDDHILFEGSLGLLGDWATGKRVARDGKTEMYDEDATAFALEWQVRDTDPQLFNEARFPQYPTQCTPPKKMMGNRLGLSHMKEEAEKACAHWKDDMDDCIFDVIATRDVLVAAEGSVSMSS